MLVAGLSLAGPARLRCTQFLDHFFGPVRLDCPPNSAGEGKNWWRISLSWKKFWRGRLDSVRERLEKKSEIARINIGTAMIITLHIVVLLGSPMLRPSHPAGAGLTSSCNDYENSATIRRSSLEDTLAYSEKTIACYFPLLAQCRSSLARPSCTDKVLEKPTGGGIQDQVIWERCLRPWLATVIFRNTYADDLPYSLQNQYYTWLRQ